MDDAEGLVIMGRINLCYCVDAFESSYGTMLAVHHSAFLRLQDYDQRIHYGSHPVITIPWDRGNHNPPRSHGYGFLRIQRLLWFAHVHMELIYLVMQRSNLLPG